MELKIPFKNRGEDKFNFIVAEIIDRNGSIIKVNTYENSVVFPYVNNKYYNVSKTINIRYTKVMLNGRVIGIKSCSGTIIGINRRDKTCGKVILKNK